MLKMTIQRNCQAVSDSVWPPLVRRRAHRGVLLADEPTGNLDKEAAKGSIDLLQELHRD